METTIEPQKFPGGQHWMFSECRMTTAALDLLMA